MRERYASLDYLTEEVFLLINAKDTPRNTAATIGTTNARMTSS
ncbi:MAG: hypothetical protein K0S84_779 [Nitrososphaera sp.]|jgi:hypothetical protein|nr:hypothetical protein [Nitrososphaera sp.]